MRIDVAFDAAPLFARLRNSEKRLTYGVVNAINAVALRVQQAEFQHVREKFIIRNPRFFFGSGTRVGGVAARIIKFASVGKGVLYAEVATGAEAVGGRRNVLLPQFETGGQKTPTPPSKSIAIPLLGRPARPAINRPVPPAFTFGGLHLVAYKGGKRVRRRRRGRTTDVGVFGEFGRLVPPEASGKIQWKGQQRTFLLPTSANAPLGGVFQRIGPGRGDIREIYKFQATVPIDQRLGFVATAQETAARWFREEIEREAIKALAHDQGR